MQKIQFLPNCAKFWVDPLGKIQPPYHLKLMMWLFKYFFFKCCIFKFFEILFCPDLHIVCQLCLSYPTTKTIFFKNVGKFEYFWQKAAEYCLLIWMWGESKNQPCFNWKLKGIHTPTHHHHLPTPSISRQHSNLVYYEKYSDDLVFCKVCLVLV